MYDTHVHFDLMASGGADIDACLTRAAGAGVTRMLAVGGGAEGNAFAVALAGRMPERVRCAVGFNRDCAGGPCDEGGLRALARNPGVAAVGETGLDYHHTPETAAAQRALCERMLELALELRLPAVVHSREADADTLALLRPYAARGGTGVLHSFTGGWPFARAVLDLGFFVSFSGIVTFRNAALLREVAGRIPEDRLLLETDAPYLAPVPHRGRPNEPAYLGCTAAAVAAARGEEAPRVGECAFRNAVRLFDG